MFYKCFEGLNIILNFIYAVQQGAFAIQDISHTTKPPNP